MDPIREHVTIGRQGRLVIPARIREALSIREGSRVTLEVRDGKLHVHTVRSAIDRARRALDVTGPLAAGTKTWSEELIADRRHDAAREGRTR